MKAKKGDRIILKGDISYSSDYDTINIPKGKEFHVFMRKGSDDGILAVETFEHNLGNEKTTSPYTILDRDYEIIPNTFDVKKVKNDIVNWLQLQMRRSNGRVAVVGISGGKDSSVVAALCVEAIGKENVIGVLMPQREQSDISYSYDLVNYLGIKHCVVNIGETVNVEIKKLEEALEEELPKQARINLPARIRMTTLYGIAQSVNHGRVMNTCNLSEDYIGYSTKYGDSAGDMAPISDLTVGEVKMLGRELGLPKHLIEKVPSDGLSGLTDEDNIGFTYEVLDRYIREGVCEDNYTRILIETKYNYNLHKLQLMPKFELK